jgi:hypothetical protein
MQRRFIVTSIQIQWLYTAKSMQRWFIITSVQNYGHVAGDQEMLVHDHRYVKAMAI